jgi:hypothetical protein
VPHIFANETRWHLFCFDQRVRDAGLESGDLFKPRSLSGFRCAKMAAILPFWISRDMAVTGWPVDIEEDARSAVEGGEAGLVFLDACFAVAGDVDEETGDPVRQHLEHGAGLAAAIGVQRAAESPSNSIRGSSSPARQALRKRFSSSCQWMCYS